MRQFAHPLEEVLGITPGSTLMGPDERDDYEMIESAPEEVMQTEPQPDVKDADDVEIDADMKKIHDLAIDSFHEQTAYIETIEPRYAARNAEVAAGFLSIALNAAAARARTKNDRRRSNQFIPHSNGGKTTNNIVVADRNEILRMITIDSETKEIK